MISRKTAATIGRIYEVIFTEGTGLTAKLTTQTWVTVKMGELYDFLFENDHPYWLCNKVKTLIHMPRSVQEMIMQLHTGETQFEVTPTWSWDERMKLGQQLLEKLAENILFSYKDFSSWARALSSEQHQELTRLLELDGYTISDERLNRPEMDALDVEEAIGAIEALITKLGLSDHALISHHVALSEEHYLNGKWDDSIGNSRKFLEATLTAVARTHSSRILGIPLAEGTAEKPSRVREYLVTNKLLEIYEKNALAEIYGLLSKTGGHPYMAENDQARLLRHLALTCAQFVLIRLRGALGI